MKALASSSSPTRDEGQHAGAHSGLTHPAGGPLETPSSARSGQGPEQAPAIVGPVFARPISVGYDPLHAAGLGRYELVDQRGTRVARGLVGLNSSAAWAHIVNMALEGYGLCLVHLQEGRPDGTCFACSVKASPSEYAVVRR